MHPGIPPVDQVGIPPASPGKETRPPRDQAGTHPPRQGDMDNERVVCILLECNHVRFTGNDPVSDHLLNG